MRVLTLDCDLGVGEDHFRFGSTVSIFDYDVVFWDPASTLRHAAEYSGTYMGRDSLRTDDSARIIQDVKRRRAEFKEFVDMGRSLVVFLPGDTKVYVDSGERTYSGTGRNRQTTRLVKEFDLVSAIPADVDRSHGSGVEMVAANSIMASLYKQTAEHWTYRCVLSEHKSISPILKIKGTAKTVAGMITAKTGGVIVLLPALSLPFANPADADLEEEPDEPDQSLPNAGCNSADAQSEVDETPWAGDLLLAWVESLISEPDSSLPVWTADFQFSSEVDRSNALREVEERLAQVQQQLDRLKAEQAQDERWKALIAGTGTSLERRVHDALEALGFELEEGDPGRTDLRGHFDGQRVVVEVKGVTKSAAERNAAQLEKWVSEELAEDRSAKGILVVNTWRDLPVSARKQADFPDQMLQYSEQRGHCLVTGLQLLSMVRTALEDPDKTTELAELILSTIGTVDGWDDPTAIFVPRQASGEQGGNPVVEENGQVDARDAPTDDANDHR